jgi:2-keto-4-pentenoate hydratase/2-oxohepta-3-ene-1,7-dioic acid hydratase in catechol pathway
MRLFRFRRNDVEGLAIDDGGRCHGLTVQDVGFPGELHTLFQGGPAAFASAADALSKGEVIDPDEIEYLPPVARGAKLLCVGLNYLDHGAESGFALPPHPTIFARFHSSLVGHRANLVRPKASEQFDFEGELVAVIGKTARHIKLKAACDHVGAYSIFNDGTVRDYQLETSQWTVGKNFDGTGAFGPYLVTADEVVHGGSGLRLQTRLNGQVVQSASTGDMIYSVASTIAFLSTAMTLNPGDVLIMGTPSGVGFAREPKLFMKPGDICEVEIEGLGTLSNSVTGEPAEPELSNPIASTDHSAVRTSSPSENPS